MGHCRLHPFSDQDIVAIGFQSRNILRHHFPSHFRVNGTVAMGNNIAHGFDLPPGDARMGCAEVLRQLADQLPNLKDTEGRCVSINGVIGKNGITVSKAVDGCFDLLTV